MILNLWNQGQQNSHCLVIKSAVGIDSNVYFWTFCHSLLDQCLERRSMVSYQRSSSTCGADTYWGALKKPLQPRVSSRQSEKEAIARSGVGAGQTTGRGDAALCPTVLLQHIQWNKHEQTQIHAHSLVYNVAHHSNKHKRLQCQISDPLLRSLLPQQYYQKGLQALKVVCWYANPILK